MENLEVLMKLHYVLKYRTVGEQCYLALYKEGVRISPYVRNISLDEETDHLLVDDVVSITQSLTCDIHFYLDETGCPKGFAWSNMMDYFIDIETPFENEYDFRDQTSYEAFLLEFRRQIKEEMEKRENFKKQEARKLLLHSGRTK